MFGQSSRNCPVFRKIRKRLALWSLEISEIQTGMESAFRFQCGVQLFAFIIAIFDVIIFTDRESENENNHEFCATEYFITVVCRIKLFNTKNCNKPRGYSRGSVAEWLGHPPEEVAGSSPALST